MVSFHESWSEKPFHVVYNVPIWKGWLLEHFYGFRFWTIFDFSRIDSRIHPLAIGILTYTPTSIIRCEFTIIIPFYGIFVTFQNFDFRELFWPYWKRDEPDLAFGVAKWSLVMPSVSGLLQNFNFKTISQVCPRYPQMFPIVRGKFLAMLIFAEILRIFLIMVWSN